MPYQKCSPIVSNQKPVNIFYVWYAELCRRLNSAPAPVVKPAKPKSETVLNFLADRLKVEEWNPVINALRHDTSLHVIAIRSRLGNCQFLHEVDTEEKLRQMKRRSGSLWTAFILKSLLKSLSCTVRNTQVLTCLEFDGLPMFAQYLEPLMKALQKNKTLKNLSLSRCRITDEGCRMVCAYLRFAPNIEVLNLSGCSLTAESGEHVAKLIKYQQINRYCESWHNSLRYADPNVHVMRGIKRVTLNHNPAVGDRGLDFILNELDDDLWIKALDMQNCGITDGMGMRIVDLVDYSQSLEIADFRLNEEMSEDTLEKIFAVLKRKHISSEYQWCNTSYTLTTCESVCTVSNYTSKTPSVYKVKSAPLKQAASKMISAKPVRRTKTVENIPNKSKKEEESFERRLQELNNLLHEEIAKRRETEKVNEELRRKLSEMIDFPKRTSKNKVGVSSKQTLNQKPDSIYVDMFNMCKKNGVKKKNGFKNGYHGKNGVSILPEEKACTILDKLLVADGESSDEGSLLDYGREQEEVSKRDEGKLMNGYDMTDSQISLFKFMENLKNNMENSSVKFVHHQNASKYYVNVKKKM